MTVSQMSFNQFISIQILFQLISIFNQRQTIPASSSSISWNVIEFASFERNSIMTIYEFSDSYENKITDIIEIEISWFLKKSYDWTWKTDNSKFYSFQNRIFDDYLIWKTVISDLPSHERRKRWPVNFVEKEIINNRFINTGRAAKTTNKKRIWRYVIIDDIELHGAEKKINLNVNMKQKLFQKMKDWELVSTFETIGKFQKTWNSQKKLLNRRLKIRQMRKLIKQQKKQQRHQKIRYQRK